MLQQACDIQSHGDGEFNYQTLWVLDAEPHCGTAPYSYYWNVSYDGINYTVLSTQKRVFPYTIPKPPGNQKFGTVYLKLNIVDSQGKWVYLKKAISFSCM
ncbi:MAG: hypothetical protein JNL57_03715 [Bacteroidetes bacterium]|nr:hypothetical protein [Bacteroidota bacterium]